MSWYKPSERAKYLYDGLYAEDLDGQIVLSAMRGRELDYVCLEDHTLTELFRFLEQARGIKIEVKKRSTP